jgi:hypothetical protein
MYTKEIRPQYIVCAFRNSVISTKTFPELRLKYLMACGTLWREWLNYIGGILSRSI